jgi:hypothetical protein
MYSSQSASEGLKGLGRMSEALENPTPQKLPNLPSKTRLSTDFTSGAKRPKNETEEL